MPRTTERGHTAAVKVQTDDPARLLLARRSDAFGRLIRIFAEQIQSWQRDKARQQGIVAAHGGGLSFPHRFGGSLNLNTHIHAVFADGVFTLPTMNDDGETSRESRARFHLLPAPQTADLELICKRSAERFHRWLRRRRLIADEGDRDASAPPDRSALDACTESSLGVGELMFIDEKGQPQRRGSRRDEDHEHELPAPRGDVAADMSARPSAIICTRRSRSRHITVWGASYSCAIALAPR